MLHIVLDMIPIDDTFTDYKDHSTWDYNESFRSVVVASTAIIMYLTEDYGIDDEIAETLFDCFPEYTFEWNVTDDCAYLTMGTKNLKSYHLYKIKYPKVVGCLPIVKTYESDKCLEDYEKSFNKS